MMDKLCVCMGYVKMTQKGLTKRIIEALRIEDLPAVDTPATGVLGKDPDDDPPNCTFNYASVIGMLWCLCGHSCCDLGFAVSQGARFSIAPKCSHELALMSAPMSALTQTRLKIMLVSKTAVLKWSWTWVQLIINTLVLYLMFVVNYRSNASVTLDLTSWGGYQLQLETS